MANKLYAMEQLTEEVAKDVAVSPQEWMRFLNITIMGKRFMRSIFYSEYLGFLLCRFKIYTFSDTDL